MYLRLLHFFFISGSFRHTLLCLHADREIDAINIIQNFLPALPFILSYHVCVLMVGLYRTLPEPRSKLQAMNRSALTVKYGSAMDSLISNGNRVFLSSTHSERVNLTESGLQDAPLSSTIGNFLEDDIPGNRFFLPCLVSSFILNNSGNNS